MCTALVSIDPQAPVPVLLVGVRDEFNARPWAPPGAHWPDRPGLVGGVDLRAGGTWLAVDPRVPRAACILNGHGPQAPDAARRSRGELPLLLAGEGKLGAVEFDRYDPFHLIGAEPGMVRLYGWNGRQARERVLGPGLHIVVNSGLEGVDDPDARGAEEMAARIAHFRPLLAAAHRPQPGDGGDTATAWGDWLPVVDGGGLDPADPAALIVARSFEQGEWGTGSVSLVALWPGGVRYDFRRVPGEWGRVSAPR